MAITKQKKVEIVEKLGGILNDAQSVVFVRFHGYSIVDEHALRNKLKEEGVGYYVAKKTLVARALDTHSYAGERPPFEGELALAYGVDAVAPAREVASFAKTSDGALSIVGGIFEGTYKSAAEMQEIASIPSLQVLRGMFVNVVNSPIQGMAIVLSEIAKKKETAA